MTVTPSGVSTPRAASIARARALSPASRSRPSSTRSTPRTTASCRASISVASRASSAARGSSCAGRAAWSCSCAASILGRTPRAGDRLNGFAGGAAVRRPGTRNLHHLCRRQPLERHRSFPSLEMKGAPNRSAAPPPARLCAAAARLKPFGVPTTATRLLRVGRSFRAPWADRRWWRFITNNSASRCSSAS